MQTLYDAWIPEFGSGSGMDPDPAGFRVVGSGPDPDPAGTKISRSGLDPDPAGSENCGSGAPLVMGCYQAKLFTYRSDIVNNLLQCSCSTAVKSRKFGTCLAFHVKKSHSFVLSEFRHHLS